MKTKDMFAIFNAELARLNAIDADDGTHIDWLRLFTQQMDTEWLVTDFWPVGRQIHMHAARKTGKSLMSLWIAGNLAMGRDPFTGAPMEPVRVAYLDYEMTESDLLERCMDFGWTPEQLGSLFYYMYPALPMLDTADGGKRLMELLTAVEAQAVVIDTMSRVVEGDENSNDTYIRFYKHTGQLLKANGIALFRLDHEGHESGRSRGASSKADDVDIVWQLRKADGSVYELVRKAARVAWVPEKVVVNMVDEPTLSFVRAHDAWPAGTAEKAQELDACDVPLDTSRRKASEMLKAHGYKPGTTLVLQAALRYRNNRVFGI